MGNIKIFYVNSNHTSYSKSLEKPYEICLLIGRNEKRSVDELINKIKECVA